VDEGLDAHGAAVAEGDVVGLEDPLLHRVALDRSARVEGAVGAEGDEGPLRDVAAVVEQPRPDAHAEEPPHQALHRGAVEDRERRHEQLPDALVPPEVGVVERAVPRSQPPEPGSRPLGQAEVRQAEQQDQDRGRHHRRGAEPVEEVRGDQPEQREAEEVAPANQQEQPDGAPVVAVLGGQPGAQLVAGPEQVLVGVCADRTRDLEAGRVEVLK
jgi:hypothetical protein